MARIVYLRLGMTKNTIQPGSYRLVRDITNPTPDRRSPKDWQKRPTFAAGAEFVVLGDAMTDVEIGESEYKSVPKPLPNHYQRIEMIGARTYDYLTTLSDAGQALIAGLERIDETFEGQCRRLDANHLGVEFVRRLISRGLLTREQFEIEYLAWLEDGAE